MPVNGDLFRVHRSRIHLESDLRALRQTIILADLIHTANDPFRIDHRRRASTEINSIENFVGKIFGPILHFSDHASHVRIGKADLAGIRCKIAIPALRPAKGNVNVNSGHNFSFETKHRSLTVHDPMTGYHARQGIDVKRISHSTGGTRTSAKARDLAVGSHFADRNFLNNLVHARKKIFFHFSPLKADKT